MTAEEYKKYMAEKQKAQKPTKYKSIKTEVDGIKFDSKKEAEYYGVLKLRKRKGMISAFTRQERFKIIINGILVCTYVSDFVVYDTYGNRTEIIDVKSDFTRKMSTYRLKKKLMKAVLNIEIKEV